MNLHSLNLGLRFLLEIAALISFGFWGWQKGENWARFVLAPGIPIIAAAVWAIFRVPNDPGPAPVAIPGALRLLLELAFFALAVWALHDLKFTVQAWVLGALICLHYVLSYERVLWMVKR